MTDLIFLFLIVVYRSAYVYGPLISKYYFCILPLKLIAFIFYAFKVLYKSRCDSRFNEVSERAAADKHEVWTY